MYQNKSKKLKNKHTFLKNIQTEKAEEPLILTKQKETKTKYFAPMFIFNIIVRCPRRYKHCIIATFFYIALFHQIYQNNSFVFTSSFPFFSKLKIFTLDTNKRLPRINLAVSIAA